MLKHLLKETGKALLFAVISATCWITGMNYGALAVGAFAALFWITEIFMAVKVLWHKKTALRE